MYNVLHMQVCFLNLVESMPSSFSKLRPMNDSSFHWKHRRNARITNFDSCLRNLVGMVFELMGCNNCKMPPPFRLWLNLSFQALKSFAIHLQDGRKEMDDGIRPHGNQDWYRWTFRNFLPSTPEISLLFYLFTYCLKRLGGSCFDCVRVLHLVHSCSNSVSWNFHLKRGHQSFT